MKRYIAISITLHTLALGLAFYKISRRVPQKPDEPIPMVVSLSGESAHKIAPKSISPVTKKATDGYWGVGLYSRDTPDAIIVTDVMEGWAAARAGLMAGDEIISIDDQPLSVSNWLRGDGPRRMLLQVRRSKQVFYVDIEREWIETF